MRAHSQPAQDGFAPRESAPPDSALAFRIQGSSDPVVFLHGVGLNKDAWREQEDFFSSRRTTIVCDLPGHGQSPLPPARNADPADSANLADYSAPIAALLDELGFASADVVGHSFGGLAALDFALRFPERTRRVVVLNGVFCRAPAAQKAAIARAAALASGSAPPDVESALRRWFGDSQDSQTIALADEVRQWLQHANPCGYARAYRLFAECDAVFAPHLPHLAVPALFATGENDPHSTAEMSRAMAQLAPQGQCEILTGQRHMAALAAPDIVNPILLNFLNSPTPTHSPARSPAHSPADSPSVAATASAPTRPPLAPAALSTASAPSGGEKL